MWDPKNNGFFNQGYSLNRNENGVSFTPNGGTFYRYNNERGSQRGLVDHLYWDKRTGDAYYLDPDSNQYTKLDTSNFDTSGGMFRYASDSQLEEMTNAAAATIAGNRAQRRDQQQKAQQQALINSRGTIASIPVPTATTPGTLQQEEYAKRRAEADKLLQKYMTPSVEATPEVDNTVYYKYGPDEIDLKYYLHNLGTNLQSYMDSQDWSQAQKQAFLNSYENYKQGLTEQLNRNSQRFYTDDAGIIRDADNLLSSDTGTLVMDSDGNIYNSIDDIADKRARKSAVEFSPNSEVGAYLNTIGQAIVGAGKVRSKGDNSGDFDLNKHGFVNYWLNKVSPAGGTPDIDPYLALDPVSPEGKRERTNRTKYLVHELNNYLNYINNGTHNFDNSSYKSKDFYTSKIKEAIDNLNNGWDVTDPNSLQAIGITPDFYDVFMSDASNPLLSEAELSEEMQKRKETAAQDYIADVESFYKNYANAPHTFTSENKLYFAQDKRFAPGTVGAEQRIANALEALGYPADPENVQASADQLWNSVKAALRGGSSTVNTLAGPKKLTEVLPVIFPMYEQLFTESPNTPGVKYLDDPEEDSINGAVLCFKNGSLYYDFMGEFPDSTAWQQLKANFERNYSTSTLNKPKYSFYKLGGILKKLQEGGSVEMGDFDPEVLAALQQMSQTGTMPETQNYWENVSSSYSPGQALADALYADRVATAKSKGLSYNRYNAKQRTPNGAPDFYNKDSGIWKQEDYVRLGAIAADLASIPLPSVYGAAVGFGGTMANLWADWADNTVTTGELIKNLGANLGMDALSVIPVLGEAADATRLTKNLAKMAPKIMYALTAYGALATLKNGENIMESLRKATTKGEKLNVGDFQNIAQAVASLSGMSGLVKATAAKRMIKNKATMDGIGLGLRDKAGNIQDHLFTGESGKKLRELVTKGDVDEVNTYLKSLDGFSDYEVNTSFKSVGVQSPLHKADSGSWEGQNPFKVNRQIDAFDLFDSNVLSQNRGRWHLIDNQRQRAIEADAQRVHDNPVTAEEKAILDQAEIERITKDTQDVKQRTEENLKAKEGAYKTELDREKQFEDAFNNAKSEQDAVQARIDATTQKYKLRSELGVKQRLAGVTKNIQKYRADLLKTESSIQRLESKKKLSPTEQQQLNDFRTEKTNLEDTLSKLRETESDLTNWQKDLSELSQKEAATTKAEADYNDLKAQNKTLQDTIDKIKKFREGNFSQKNGDIAHSRKYKELMDLITKNTVDGSYVYTDPSGTQRKIENVKDIIDKMGLFKKGGRLHFLREGNVIKAQLGVQLNSNSGTWYDDIFSGYQQAILDRIAQNPEYYKKINDMQRAHYGLYTAAGGANENWRKKAYKDSSVEAYQSDYHSQDFNKLGIDRGFERNRYAYNPNVKRLEHDRQGQSYIDGLYSSITDDRRVLGRLGDWDASQITDFNNKLATHGLKMELGEGDYYYINPFENPTTPTPSPTPVPGSSTPVPAPSPTQKPAPTQEEPLGVKPQYISINPGTSSATVPAGKKSSGKSTTTKWLDPEKLRPFSDQFFPDLRFGLLNLGNNRATKWMLAAQNPVYQRPLTNHRYVVGNLNAIASAEKQSADLVNLFYNNALTSDGALQMSGIMDASLKGQPIKMEGFNLNDSTWRTTGEQELAQEVQNNANIHAVGEANNNSGAQAKSNKNKTISSRISQFTNDLDIWLQGKEYDFKTHQAEQKALADAATQARIPLAVQNDPNKYGAGLTAKELAAYRRRQAGVSASSMSAAEQTDLANAANKISLATTNQYYSWRGIPNDRWTADANKTNKGQFPVNLSKNGSKLKIERIRNRAKNADRFQKSVQKQLDSLDKKLDRISKSMYGLPKLEMVKQK